MKPSILYGSLFVSITAADDSCLWGWCCVALSPSLELECEGIGDRVGEWIGDGVGEWIDDGAGEMVSDWAGEWIVDGVSEWSGLLLEEMIIGWRSSVVVSCLLWLWPGCVME